MKVRELYDYILTVDENLETDLTGTPCVFNSDTDSHMESYRDGIISQNTKIEKQLLLFYSKYFISLISNYSTSRCSL